MYRHFFTDAIFERHTGGGFGVSNILQQQLNKNVADFSASKDFGGNNTDVYMIQVSQQVAPEYLEWEDLHFSFIGG